MTSVGKLVRHYHLELLSSVVWMRWKWEDLTPLLPAVMQPSRRCLAQQLVFSQLSLWAGSQPKLALRSRAKPEPRRWPKVAYGSGFRFGKPLSQPMALASLFWGCGLQPGLSIMIALMAGVSTLCSNGYATIVWMLLLQITTIYSVLCRY